jgi:DNA ligase (NAD+)
MSDDKSLVQQANMAYDTGEPILTDQEFDLLADNGLDLDSRNFRTKVEHTIPMGSLDKIKTVDDLARWLRNYSNAILIVMPKLDGSSISLSYKNGELTRAVTRGDGAYGNLITDNIMETNAIKAVCGPDMEVRAEALIPKRYATQYDKNLRNTVAGMINAKDTRPELAQVDLVIFDIFGPQFETWEQKRQALNLLPKVVPYHEINAMPAPELYALLESLYNTWSSPAFAYAIDGLVVHAIFDPARPLPAPQLIPEDKVAIKFKDESKSAIVADIEWTQGMHGKLAPVLVLADGGVELDGTQVQRVSASNYSLLRAAGLGQGAKIQVIKSNQIIPFVSAIDEPSLMGIEFLPVCPDCGERSTWNASHVDAICANQDCPGKANVEIVRILEIFGIEFTSDTTVAKLTAAGYNTLEKLFAMSIDEMAAIPGFGKSSATYFVTKLHSASISEAKAFKAVGLKGLGERMGVTLLDHYGSLSAMIQSVQSRGLDSISGFGGIHKAKIEANLEAIIQMRDRLIALGVKIIPHQKALAGLTTVCATGTCPGYARGDLNALLTRLGYEPVSDVNKDCKLLLCEDPLSGSSKLKKAAKLGISVQSYRKFFQQHGIAIPG